MSYFCNLSERNKHNRCIIYNSMYTISRSFMKKYILFSILICLSGCKTAKPHTFICFNPFMPIQSIEVETDSPNVKEKDTELFLTTGDGNLVIMPKSLCVEIRKVTP